MQVNNMVMQNDNPNIQLWASILEKSVKIIHEYDGLDSFQINIEADKDETAVHLCIMSAAGNGSWSSDGLYIKRDFVLSASNKGIHVDFFGLVEYNNPELFNIIEEMLRKAIYSFGGSRKCEL